MVPRSWVRTWCGFSRRAKTNNSPASGAEQPVRWAMEDVDADGDIDMLFHFKMQELNLTPSSTEATLTGNTSDPVNPRIKGTDTVNIVPKGKK